MLWYLGSIKSLKHGKTDVQRVEKTGECGVTFKDFEAIAEGDRIMCVHVEKYKDEVSWNLWKHCFYYSKEKNCKYFIRRHE